MSLLVLVPDPDREPTAAQLAAIEAEWPVISAEMHLLEAQLAAQESPSELAVLRLRLAQSRLDRARRVWTAASWGEAA